MLGESGVKSSSHVSTPMAVPGLQVTIADWEPWFGLRDNQPPQYT